MKLLNLLVAMSLAAVVPEPALAQNSPANDARAKDVPTKVEYYYRVRWGSLNDFISLYDRNHKSLLEEMRKQGFILDMKTEFPFTHLAGGPRWDMRVTITYRDAAAALNDPAWEEQWDRARKAKFNDLAKLEAEEATRFSYLEDHWDVIIADFPG